MQTERVLTIDILDVSLREKSMVMNMVDISILSTLYTSKLQVYIHQHNSPLTCDTALEIWKNYLNITKITQL
jgi:hypothetical protein